MVFEPKYHKDVRLACYVCLFFFLVAEKAVLSSLLEANGNRQHGRSSSTPSPESVVGGLWLAMAIGEGEAAPQVLQ